MKNYLLSLILIIILALTSFGQILSTQTASIAMADVADIDIPHPEYPIFQGPMNIVTSPSNDFIGSFSMFPPSDVYNTIIAFQFDAYFDSSVFRPSGSNFGCTTVGAVTNGHLSVVCNVIGNRLLVAGYGILPILANGPIVNVHFEMISGPASIPPPPESIITLDRVMLFPLSGHIHPAILEDGVITFEGFE